MAMAQSPLADFFKERSASFHSKHVRQDHNPYDWLDSDDDEDNPHSPKRTTYIPRAPNTFSVNRGSPSTLTELRNANGKRAASHANPYQPFAQDRKRVKVETKLRERTVTNGQTRVSTRPPTIDLSDSPPPMARHPNFQQQQTRPVPQKPVVQNKPVPSHTNPSAPVRITPQEPSKVADSRLGEWLTAQQSIRPGAHPEPNDPIPAWRQLGQKLKTERHDSPRTSTPKASGPFQIEDSSDDEDVKMAPSPQPRPRIPEQHHRAFEHRRPAARPRPRIDPAQRERQFAESRKRREEAEQKKRQSPNFSGLDVHDSSGGKDEGDADDCVIIPKPSAFRDVVEPRSQMRREIPSSAKTDSVMDLESTGSTPQNPLSAVNKYLTQESIAARTEATKREEERLRAKALVDPQGKKYEELHAHQTAKEAKAKQEKEKRDAERLEAKRTQQVELQTHLVALDVKEERENVIRKAADAKRRAQEDERQQARARIQADHEQQLQKCAEAAQRSRPIVEAQRKLEVQKKLDAEKDARAEKEEAEKRRLEKEKWEARRKAEEEEREVMRKRQGEAEKEKSGFSDREAALARLSALKAPQPLKKVEVQVTSLDVNDVAERYNRPRVLHCKNGRNDGISADLARQKVNAIQERNGQSSMSRPKAPEGQREMTDRDRRIEDMAGRNMRMREAEERQSRAEDDGELVLENDEPARPAPPIKHETVFLKSKPRGRHDSRVPPPTSPPLPKGPQSLNSAAGQALLANASAPSPSQDRPTSAIRSKSRNHGRQLGEIQAGDARLVLWRDTGMLFHDISLLWPKNFGFSRSSDTVRARYKQVKEALRNAGVEQHLVEQLSGGSAEAREQINRAVHGRWPLVENEKVAVPVEEKSARSERAPDAIAGRARDAKGHFLPTPGGAGGGRAKSVAPGGSFTASFGWSCTEGTLAHEEEPAPRPTTGGKTMNEQAYRYYLEMLAEEHEREAAEQDAEDEAAFSREASPITKDDRRQYVYWVERREISQEDLDDGYGIEDGTAWGKCSLDFEDVEAANAKAAKAAYCVPPLMARKVDLGKSYSTSCRTLEHGMKVFKTWWEDVGEVEVRVVREDNYSGDAVVPTNKARWLGRKLWMIWKRTTKTSTKTTEENKEDKEGEGEGEGEDDSDGLFTEKKTDTNSTKTVMVKTTETDVTTSVNDHVYSSLEEANNAAIKHVVNISFTPTSANLTARELEVQAAVKHLEDEHEEREADAGEEVCFKREMQDEEDGTKVVVEVREVGLKGPRNL